MNIHHSFHLNTMEQSKTNKRSCTSRGLSGTVTDEQGSPATKKINNQYEIELQVDVKYKIHYSTFINFN